jgi:hypothetical protein
MTIEILRTFFGWCTVLNMGFYLAAVVVILCCKDWAFKLHGKMFRLTPGQLEPIFYCYLGAYKLLLIVFCFIPWLALTIMG